MKVTIIQEDGSRFDIRHVDEAAPFGTLPSGNSLATRTQLHPDGPQRVLYYNPSKLLTLSLEPDTADDA